MSLTPLDGGDRALTAQPDGVAFDPALAALAFGDDTVFLNELVGGLLEGLLGFQDAGAVLAAQGQIPVLSNLPRQREAIGLGAGALLLSTDGRGALPKATVCSLIELNLPTEEVMRRHEESGDSG